MKHITHKFHHYKLRYITQEDIFKPTRDWINQTYPGQWINKRGKWIAG